MCEEVLDGHPGDPYALNCKGRACQRMGQSEEAEEAFERAATAPGRGTRVEARRGLEDVRRDYLSAGNRRAADRIAATLSRWDDPGR